MFPLEGVFETTAANMQYNAKADQTLYASRAFCGNHNSGMWLDDDERTGDGVRVCLACSYLVDLTRYGYRSSSRPKNNAASSRSHFWDDVVTRYQVHLRNILPPP